MKFLIAGFGSIGRRHLRNLRALGESDILLYRTHKSTLTDEEIDGLVVESDIGAALSHKPDGVIISNPTALHMDVAIPAARAGCSILLEKPIAQNLERIDEFEDALIQGHARVLVGFQFRFHPSLQYIRRLFKTGGLGRPVSVRAHWGEYLPAWHPWEDYRQSYSARSDLGGGAALTLCHPFDYLRWLVGEVESVWGYAGHLGDLEIDVEDTAEIGLKFVNGAVGSIHLDYLQRPPIHRFEIICTEGTIEWNNSSGAVRIFRASTDSWESFLAPVGFDRNDLFMAEMRNFLDILRGEEQPRCTLQDGIEAIRLVEAFYQAAKSGGRVALDHFAYRGGKA
ncbi:MAG TPA: Gfo/Idh/MocA family oxidoreductase [Anaerolineaceae bacterium]|nr:Gfo/Idh/MocA family oxidoreductase [Anaerolineaceae bacterium]